MLLGLTQVAASSMCTHVCVYQSLNVYITAPTEWASVCMDMCVRVCVCVHTCACTSP